jgi:hypothetical protein
MKKNEAAESTSRRLEKMSYNSFETTGENDETQLGINNSDDGNAAATIDGDTKLVKLGLIALTTPGVKFFKSSQSSFQEYLMNDPNIQMSATTYGFMLTLLSMPIVPLVGGALLDWKSDPDGNTNSSSNNNNNTNKICDNGKDDDDPGQEIAQSNTTNTTLKRYNSGNLVLSLRSITTSVRESASNLPPKRTAAVAAAQSYSFVGFLAIAALGIFIYGIGLSTPWVKRDLAITLGLAGATVFGIGEGCVMVAARAFVGHIFLGGDGAFAQGVLIAANDLSMMASKNVVPWLIETKQQARVKTLNNNHNNSDQDKASIRIGVLACFVVQLLGLLAGILYTRECVREKDNDQALAQRRKKKLQDEEQQSLLQSNKLEPRDEQPSFAMIKQQQQLDRMNEDATKHAGGEAGAIHLRSVMNLPLIFWIVASGRAIFVVTFKVFSRYSNSFIIEKFGVGAIQAGRLSSVNELFGLFSPLVGFLAYRSPGGIVAFAIGAALLGTVSIGSLALLPADGIKGLPGGLLAPLVGVSIAHGILIPICMAMIPHTVSPKQLGMAFAVFEVLGNLLHLTDIVFGWLRDYSGNYDAAMKLLYFYAILGTGLLWISRERIGSIGMGVSSSRPPRIL